MFVLRPPDGPRAYVNVCPHQGARLEYRKDAFLSVDGRHIVCFAHGAQFDPGTGAGTHGACIGQWLRALACEVREGWVWVESPLTWANR